jgi:uncharacterized membrane protein
MSEPVEVRARPFAERVAAVALLVLAAAFLLHQLYSAWCAMTWFKYHQGDYGNYVNMLWNTAHGRPFRMNVDENYLTVHLSFTLALLSVFYHVWDHAFLLALLQWLMVAGGAGLVWAMARRRGLAPMATAALVLFFCGYFFTQRVLLSDFHTVATYYLLFPWLCYTMAFRKGWAWLPWVLILGVREDAFLFALPAIVYFAVRDRWRGGWWMAAAGVAYGVLAMTVLYPWINGASLLDHRQNMTALDSAVTWTLSQKLMERVPGLFWTALPLLALVRAPVLPALLFPIAAYLTCVFSGYPLQFRMLMHYPAPVVVCLTMGMIESLALAQKRTPQRAPRAAVWRALVLTAVVLGAHIHTGFLWGGGKFSRPYRRQSPEGLAAIRASGHAPADGTLVTDFRRGGIFSHRADIAMWHRWTPQRFGRELVYSPLADLPDWAGGAVAREFLDGAYGVWDFDGTSVLLKQGHRGAEDELVRAVWSHPERRLDFRDLALHAGDNRYASGATLVRYWDGDGSRAPVTIAYGRSILLPPGRWEAWVRCRAEAPHRQPRRYWARLEIYPLGAAEPLASAEFDRIATPPGDFRTQRLAFDLDRDLKVEPRVVAGDAELWLDFVVFVPAPAQVATSETKAR